MKSLASQIERAADLLRGAESIVVFTGAGISQESGIPTFRDALDGIWAEFSPEELATPEAFAKDPQRVREFYEYRRTFVKKAKPNAGHLAIAALEALVPEVIVITQNVDGLHEAAGSQCVIALHGEILTNRCHGGCPGTHPGPATICPTCGHNSLRPNVVWFGERIDPIRLSRSRISIACASALLVVGTSGVVFPAAGLVSLAADKGVPIVEINPECSPFSDMVEVFLPRLAGQALPKIVTAIGVH